MADRQRRLSVGNVRWEEKNRRRCLCVELQPTELIPEYLKRAAKLWKVDPGGRPDISGLAGNPRRRCGIGQLVDDHLQHRVHRNRKKEDQEKEEILKKKTNKNV